MADLPQIKEYLISTTYKRTTGNAEISIFTTNLFSNFSALDPATNYLQQIGFNAQSLVQQSLSSSSINYLGSVDIINQSSSYSTSNIQVLPSTICSNAQKFVGTIWNINGCWVLASNIATLSGTSLPASSLSGGSPASNMPWIVAYSGLNVSNPTVALAESYLRPGDIVTVLWSTGGGHIFTVVSGYGANALTIDNTGSGLGGYGPIPANDGFSSDIIIQSPHSVATLLAGQVIPSSINIYRLDTPTISLYASNVIVKVNSNINLANTFTANDAGGKGGLAITSYSFYSKGTGSAVNDQFKTTSVTQTFNDPNTPLIINSADLTNLTLQTSSGLGGTNQIYIKAFNGLYWGDWVCLNINEVTSISNSGNVATFSSLSSSLSENAYTIVDTSSNISSNTANLFNKINKINGIELTDPNSNISLTASQIALNSQIFSKFTSAININISDTASHLNGLNVSTLKTSNITIQINALDSNMQISGGSISAIDLSALPDATFQTKSINKGTDTEVDITSNSITHSLIIAGQQLNSISINANFSSTISSITGYGLTTDSSTLLIQFKSGALASIPYNNGNSSVNLGGATYLVSNIASQASSIGSSLMPVFTDGTGGNTSYLLPIKYTGPASLGLQWQLITTEDNAVITGASSNDFIKVSSTNSTGKAVNGGGGTDVIDGGMGSTFISGGGTGASAHAGDTFFLDGRAPGVSWSTITDFKFGSDQATIWGFVKGVSAVDTNSVFSNPNVEGAAGYTGLTLHFDNLLPDGLASGTNANLNSITLSGHTLAEIGVTSLQDLNNQIAKATTPNSVGQYIVNNHILIGQTNDSAGTHSYLYIH